MVRPLWLVCALLLGACADRPTLLIQVRHPTGVDPAGAKGTLSVTIEEALTGARVHQQDLDTASLGSTQSLVEGLELVEGKDYLVRLAAQYAEALCGASQQRAVGTSPPFTYATGLGEVSVYLDCADASSPTGTPLAKRLYHTATLLLDPAPHGQVVVIAGAEPNTDLENLEAAVLYDSIEQYDPVTGTFNALSAKLSRPRMLHQSFRGPGPGEVVVTGGLDKVTVVNKTSVVSLAAAERVRDGHVTPLPELVDARSYHAAVAVGDQVVLAGGMGSNIINLQKSVELYDPSGGVPPQLAPSMARSRFSMAAVPFGDDRRVLLSGGVRVAGMDLPDEILCLSGSCPCGAPPCIQEIPAFGKGNGRYGLTGTRVDCKEAGEGAIYLVGGSYKEVLTNTNVYFDDIYCLELAQPTALQLVGHLSRPRSGHSATLVRGPGGPRVLVAGGSGVKTNGEETIWQNAELFDAACHCQQIDSAGQQEVQLGGPRALHTATLLPDGTVLLLGGIFAGFAAERFNPDL
jgi:hypothetical protein